MEYLYCEHVYNEINEKKNNKPNEVWIRFFPAVAVTELSTLSLARACPFFSRSTDNAKIAGPRSLEGGNQAAT